MAQHLIVTPDDSTAAIALRQFGHSDAADRTLVCSCREDFTVGPLPGSVDPAGFQRLRHRYWRRRQPGPKSNAPVSILPFVSASDTVEIWCGSAAREQLTLMAVVSTAVLLGKQAGSLICRVFQTPCPGGGLAWHRDEAFLNPPAPVVLSSGDLARIGRMWAAATAAEPGDLLSLSRDGTLIDGLPHLNRGLQVLLDCYPDEASGLDLWDRLLLEEVAAGVTVGTGIIAPILSGQRGPHEAGDVDLICRLQDMARTDLPAPALQFQGDPGKPYAGPFRLTSAGADFLAARRNMVTANGINRWVGGVHLSSRTGKLWFRRADGSLRRS